MRTYTHISVHVVFGHIVVYLLLYYFCETVLGIYLVEGFSIESFMTTPHYRHIHNIGADPHFNAQACKRNAKYVNLVPC